MMWQVTLGAVMSDKDVPEPRFNGHPLYGPKIEPTVDDQIEEPETSILLGIAGVVSLALVMVIVAYVSGWLL